MVDIMVVMIMNTYLVAISITVASISSKGKSQCMMFDRVETLALVLANTLSSFVTSLFLLLYPVVHCVPGVYKVTISIG